jgi:hypothetical protein
MSTAYKGRHTGADHPTPVVPKAGTASQGVSRALRRPLASAAAILAIAGVCAAGASEASPNTSASFIPSPMAAAQATELTDSSNDTNNALAAARRSGVQRASVLTHQQKTAADARARARLEAAAALGRARLEAAAALGRARVAAAEKVARDKARQGLIDRAQSNPKAVGRLLAADRGWGDAQFSCLDSLWTKESGWRWNADNPSSDAYGIPQALPGSKMSTIGNDWATNPVTQIKWGLSYISSRYGTPCSAWAHSQAVNWY